MSACQSAFAKLQVAILARSSRKMSLTVLIVWQYILSRVRVSVWPRIFLYAKNPRGNLAASASVSSDLLLSPAERAVTVGWHRIAMAVCMCVGVCRHSCGCMHTRVRACARSCMREVFAIYDNTIWHRLMIIKYYSIFHRNHTHWWFSPQRVPG